MLEQVVLLLHPVMPFVTEEIWHVIGKQRPTIMLEPYPRPRPAWRDAALEQEMEFLIGVIRAIRNLRREINCPPGREIRVVFRGASGALSLLRAQEAYVRMLARVGSAEYLEAGEPPKGAATAVVQSTEIYLPIADLVNVEEERARLQREVRKIEDELARLHRKLANQDFLTKAREEVIRGEREKAELYQEKARTLNQSLERLREAEQERS
jgi:valyl-tRNA synthetase